MKIGVVGAGSWGSAFGLYLAGLGYDVTFWAREVEVVDSINRSKVNELFLPGFRFPEWVRAVYDINELNDCEVLVNAVPVQFIRGVYSFLKFKPRVIVNLSKGIEIQTGMRVSEIFGSMFDSRYVVISGPSFAKEVAKGKPTACVTASLDGELARRISKIFSSNRFRLYYSDDVVGVELGGSLKNIIAIACGISDGLGLGLNARAALINRGLVEMARFGSFLGAKRETFFGLSGLGDLVLTATGDLSRNRRFGIELAKGKRKEDLLSERYVVEGVFTTQAVYSIATKFSIDMPITTEVYKILFLDKDPRESLEELMGREIKYESLF
ncbi:MAG: NAD(P)H-dependent glycerol-3-phosphate dehydrogenase [Thermosulfidibacteraceae bacterium]|jgi:glycerol-3-phosphate dehydrogenase (NAD(P)+)